MSPEGIWFYTESRLNVFGYMHIVNMDVVRMLNSNVFLLKLKVVNVTPAQFIVQKQIGIGLPIFPLFKAPENYPMSQCCHQQELIQEFTMMDVLTSHVLFAQKAFH